MSNDVGTDEESAPRDSEAVRDDIMKRLLDYQRRQRGESGSETVSSVWATPPVRARETEPAVAEPPMDAAPTTEEAPAAEQVPEPSEPAEAPAPSVDVQGRLDALQSSLDRLRSQIGDLRQTFQDMAIAADERLADIEAELTRARGGSEEPS